MSVIPISTSSARRIARLASVVPAEHRPETPLKYLKASRVASLVTRYRNKPLEVAKRPMTGIRTS
jgi:hypothetical protein